MVKLRPGEGARPSAHPLDPRLVTSATALCGHKERLPLSGITPTSVSWRPPEVGGVSLGPVT